MKSFAFVAVLIVVVALPLLLWRWNRRTASDFQTVLKERQLSLRAQCPVPRPFGFPDQQLGSLTCYDGQLRPGVPMVLIFGVRSNYNVGVDPHPTANSYLAIYLPKTVPLDDDWLRKWQAQVGKTQGTVTVEHAARTADGGVVIAWTGAPARGPVEDRLGELLRSLPTSN